MGNQPIRMKETPERKARCVMFYMETFNNLFWRIFINYWTLLSYDLNTLPRPRRLTLSRRNLSNSSDHQQKPNLIIVLLFNENNSLFINKLSHAYLDRCKINFCLQASVSWQICRIFNNYSTRQPTRRVAPSWLCSSHIQQARVE